MQDIIQKTIQNEYKRPDLKLDTITFAFPILEIVSCLNAITTRQTTVIKSS